MEPPRMVTRCNNIQYYREIEDTLGRLTPHLLYTNIEKNMGLVSGFLAVCSTLVFGVLSLVYCFCVCLSLLKEFILK